MRKHRHTRVLILIAVVLFICTPLMWSAGSQDTSESEGPITLRFSWWGGDARHNATLEVIRLFEEKNPNVHIEAEYGGWDGYYQKLVTQLAGGTAADIMQIDQPWLYELSARGEIFLAIDEDSGIDMSGFDRTFLNNYTSHKGVNKGLPTGLNGEAFLVDSELLEANGIDPYTDWTWENLVTLGVKFHNADDSQYLLALTADQIRFMFEKYMAQLSGPMVESDKSLGFTEQDAVQAFTYFKQWFDKDICAPLAESSLHNKKFQDSPAWINRKMALALSWASNFDQSIGTKTGMSVAALPVMDGAVDSGIIVRPSQIFTINNSSKYKEEAVKFLDFYFNNPESILAQGTSRGVPPTSHGRTLLKENSLLDPLVEKGTNLALEKMGRPQTVWQMNSEVMQVMDDIIEEFGYGILSPTEAASALIKRLNAKLEVL